MKESLSGRQVGAFCLTGLTAPAVMVCASVPWPWVLAAAVSAAAVILGMATLWRDCRTALPVLTLRVWGRKPGLAVLFLQAAFAVLLLWRLVPLTAASFPDHAARPFVPLTLLAVAAWGVWHGRAAVVRAVVVLFFFVAALYLAVFAFAVPDAEVSRLKNWEESVSLVPLAVLLLPVFGFYFADPDEKERKLPLFWLGAAVALPTVVAVLCAAVPGSRGSLYEMAKSLEVFSVSMRIEPLVSALLTLGWFAALSLVVVSVGQMAEAAGIPARWAGIAACLLATPAAVWNLSLPTGLLALFGTVFCVIIPLLTLFLGVRKKA